MKDKKKKRTKNPPLKMHIPAVALLEADDETFKGYYGGRVDYVVYGSNEVINAIWERAKKLSLQ